MGKNKRSSESYGEEGRFGRGFPRAHNPYFVTEASVYDNYGYYARGFHGGDRNGIGNNNSMTAYRPGLFRSFRVHERDPQVMDTTHKEESRSKTSSSDSEISEKTRRVHIILAVVVVVVVLLIAAMVGAVLGANVGIGSSGGKNETIEVTVTKSVYGETTLVDKDFTPALNDPNSTEYKQLEMEFISMMNETFANSDQKDTYAGVIVKGFSEGSVVTTFLLLFKLPLSVLKTEEPVDLDKINADVDTPAALEIVSATAGFMNSGLSDENKCDSSPCLNGGICDPRANSYVCQCVAGYTGTNCQTGPPDKNETIEVTVTKSVYGETTLVDKDFTPALKDPTSIEYKQLEMKFNSMMNESFSNSSQKDIYAGVIVKGFSEGSVVTEFDLLLKVLLSVLITDEPVALDRINAEVDIPAVLEVVSATFGFINSSLSDENKCDSSPCLNGGICDPRANSYVCHCVAGYTGTNCQSGPPDKNETIEVTVTKSVYGETTLVDKDFTPALKDPTSIEYKQLEMEFNSMINESFSNSSQTDIYAGVIVKGFSEGSVVTEFDLLLKVLLSVLITDEPVNLDRINADVDIPAVLEVVSATVGFINSSLSDENKCDSFPCLNGGTCDPRANSYVCQCVAGYTGTNCQSGECGYKEFLCGSGECIRNQRVCNGVPDCADASDEQPAFCAPCDLNKYRCGSDRCLRVYRLCDNEIDCDDGSDEHSNICGACHSGQYECESGECIPLGNLCDEDHDCSDSSDEQDAICGLCYSHEYLCGSGECISNYEVCDGVNDCDDDSDEQPAFCASCNSTRYQCGSGECIPYSYLCDFESDCKDASDEQSAFCGRNITTK